MCRRDQHLISLEFTPSKNLLCVFGLLARNGISCGRAQLPNIAGLLKSNLSIVCRLVSLRLSGITVAQV